MDQTGKVAVMDMLTEVNGASLAEIYDHMREIYDHTREIYDHTREIYDHIPQVDQTGKVAVMDMLTEVNG